MTMGTETMSAQTTSTAGRTLREQLTGRADPDFTMRMLPGWERRAPDAVDLAERLAALRQRCLREHRPDLYAGLRDRKSTRLNSSHVSISYAVFCLKQKKTAAR